MKEGGEPAPQYLVPHDTVQYRKEQDPTTNNPSWSINLKTLVQTIRIVRCKYTFEYCIYEHTNNSLDEH